ncbi:TIGR02452 family protein [Prauserella cavernicola]|uniref:TIGR02452 family protein n=1 Tax=Prauserella cavernicola TaxID=2800127 RepID=A0A934QS01_9PSEU|nr:TIGR02452 family protein [Prauserella cavernicola]MBK1784289.1 TIGR02452 family protein [Prauserella cavernicola]
MDRTQLAAIAEQTDRIVASGRYTSASGSTVDISPAVFESVRGTRLYLPEQTTAPPQPEPDVAAKIEVVECSTLAAARQLVDDGRDEPACLNFASARKPGGGYRTGARAQEESLARASGLVACLEAAPGYYSHHRAHRDALYTDRIIYSPGVPVFRDDEHALLAQPYQVAFLTSAAPNASAANEDQLELIPAALRQRAAKVLTVAHHNGHSRLVLGAWGCGVFGNDPRLVATTFAELLAGPFAGCFSHVVFAVLDHPGRQPLSAFRDTFAG